MEITHFNWSENGYVRGSKISTRRVDMLFMVRYHIVTHITFTLALTLSLHIVTLTLPWSICRYSALKFGTSVWYFFPLDLQKLLQSNKWRFPNYGEDLVGAMAALFRLQDTYDISTVDMVNNNIQGKRLIIKAITLHRNCINSLSQPFFPRRFLFQELLFHRKGMKNGNLTVIALLWLGIWAVGVTKVH